MKKFQFALALAFGIVALAGSLTLCIGQSTSSSIAPFSVTRRVLSVVDALTASVESEETFSALQSEPIARPQASAETPLALLALNPGYAIDGVSNVGEFIELVNLTDSPIELTGYVLRYTNATGNRSNIYVFPEGSTMVGKTLLLRLASSPEADQADLTYTKTLALEAGPLELVHDDEVVDSVCWKGADCLPKFVNKEGERTSLVKDLETGSFSHQLDYVPRYDAESPGYQPPVTPTEDVDPVAPQCRGLEFSELLTYYDSDPSEQFIELYNTSDESIDLTGCTIKYKSKTFTLSGTVEGNGYFLKTPEVTLTKNPTTSNLYELVDVTGDVVDTLSLPHGQKKSTAYAAFGSDDSGEIWLATYAPTPGAENTYQQYRSCAEGKVINEATGNCVKAATIKTLADCPEGKYRNPTTGRCKSYETDTTKECKEGYERNPETNRCRKIRNNDGADYPLVPATAGERTTFVAVLAIIAVVSVGVIYIILQYRQEIANLCRRLRLRLHHPRNRKNPKHPQT